MPWLTHDYSWGSRGINTIIILGEDAIGWEYVVCDLSEVFCLRDFSQSPPIMVGLPTKASSPTTYYFDPPSPTVIASLIGEFTCPYSRAILYFAV